MPIPYVEELGSDLEPYTLSDGRLLRQAEVVVVEPKTSKVRNPRSLAQVENVTRKPSGRLKGSWIKQWFGGFEVSFVLGEWVGTREDRRNATRCKLARQVALAVAEEERNARRRTENAGHFPSPTSLLSTPPSCKKRCPFPKGS